MYNYSIEFWNELDSNVCKIRGLISAISYADAMHKLSDFYGELNIIHISLKVTEQILEYDDILAMKIKEE